MGHTTGSQTSRESERRGRGARGSRMQSCIDVCTECHQACVRAARACLEMGGRHAAADHVRTMLDCAQICSTSADFMLRGSDLHTSTCRACAEICRACADSCDEIGGEEMSQCAEVCRRCAESCERMAGTDHHH